MKTVKVGRDELLTTVRLNFEKHKADYNEAVDDYKVLVVKLAKDNAKIAKVNVKMANAFRIKDIKHFSNVPSAPVHYSKEYERAIKMLEMSVESEIDLEEEIFNQLVMDEWSWKHHFVGANMSTKALAYGG